MIKKNMRVYIAGGFFNDKQLNRVLEVEKLLGEANIKFHSPRKVGVLKNMPRKDRASCMKTIFDSNLNEMDNSTHMISLLSDRDTGTVFETGYFVASKKPVIMLADNIKLVSVMLAMGASSICTDSNKLVDSLNGKYTEEVGDVI